MEISDDDIRRCTEIVVNMEANNATYVELRDKFLIERIKVRDKEAGFILAGHLYKYKEELHGDEIEKISTRDS